MAIMHVLNPMLGFESTQEQPRVRIWRLFCLHLKPRMNGEDLLHFEHVWNKEHTRLFHAWQGLIFTQIWSMKKAEVKPCLGSLWILICSMISSLEQMWNNVTFDHDSLRISLHNWVKLCHFEMPRTWEALCKKNEPIWSIISKVMPFWISMHTLWSNDHNSSTIHHMDMN